MNFLLPLTLHGCELPWLSWHEKQSSQPWPSTKMLGAGGKVCLATWHGPFLLPFQEAGVTFAVSYTWEIFHPSLVNLYIQVPTLKVQRTPAKSCHGMGGADLPNATLPHSNITWCPRATGQLTPSLWEPAGLLACLLWWPVSSWSHGRTSVATPIGGDKENRADESWQRNQEALLKHRQEVLSFPNCLCKLNLLQLKTSFKIRGSALAHLVLPMALCGVLPLTAPLSNLLARAGAHSPLHFLSNSQTPSRIQHPSWDYRLHAAADQTCKELSPRCSLPPSAQDHSQGMKNNPNWIIHTTTAPQANRDTALTGCSASSFPGRTRSNPLGNWIWGEWTIPWSVWNVIEDTGWILIRKKKVLIITISMGSV